AAPQDAAVAMLDVEVHGHNLASRARRRHRRRRQTVLPIAPAMPRARRPAIMQLVDRTRTPRESPSPSPLPPALMRWPSARGVDASVTLLWAARFALPADAAERDEAPITPT